LKESCCEKQRAAPDLLYTLFWQRAFSANGLLMNRLFFAVLFTIKKHAAVLLCNVLIPILSSQSFVSSVLLH
jgi:hypothetical protein